MKYAIRILEKEKQLVECALSDWDKQTYPEARELRERRLKELEKALKILSNEAEKM